VFGLIPSMTAAAFVRIPFIRELFRRWER
jgi:hypothetical protein